MNNYIKLESIINILKAHKIKMEKKGQINNNFSYDYYIGAIDELDTLYNEIKYLPVMQGHWIYSEEYGDLVTNKCSLCGQAMTTYEGKLMNYCPNCGAKMNLEN